MTSKEKACVRQIHDASMRILQEVGIKFRKKEALDKLRENGVETDGDVAKFTEKQIMDWVEKAPRVAPLYARNPEYDMQIGGDAVYPAPGYGSPAVIDADGSRRPAVLTDYIKFAKLFHVNPLYKINGGVMVQPKDVPVDVSPQILHYAAALSSDKCLVVSSGNSRAMEAVMNITGSLFDGVDKLAEKPRIITIVNTNTPLQYGESMLDTLFAFAEHGQPFVVASAAMAGTTSPITMAGTLAVANAEIISGIALAQMIRPGTPVLYASQTTSADMRSGFMASGSPEGALAYRNCALMAKYYDLPSRGGGAVTDALMVGAQSGYESMMTYMVCAQSEMNLIIHSAGIMESYCAVSFEKAICDFEIIEMVNSYLKGISFDDDAIPFDLIKKIGHGGEYMTSRHNAKNCRKALYSPKLSLRGRSKGPEQFEKNVSNTLKNMLDSYKQPDIDTERLEKLDKRMVDYGVDQRLLDQIKTYLQ